MIFYSRACMLTAFLGMAFLLPGCGPDNQKAAKIDGTVPSDADSEAARKAGAGIDPKKGGPAGYPKPGQSPGGGRTR